jgi:hypothetical protein
VRYISRDPDRQERLGGKQLLAGLALIALGAAGISAMLADLLRIHQWRIAGFAVAALIAGLGLLAMGLANRSEARGVRREIELERLRRKHRAGTMPR